MTYRPVGPHEFMYVHTDIPEGMTIREWRAQRGMPRERRAARENCWRARPLRVLAAIGRVRRVARAVVWRSEVRHSSEAHGSISA